MKANVVCVLALVGLAGVGCSKSSSSDGALAASGSSALTLTAAPGSSVAKAGGGCVPGAFKDPHGLYCLQLPEGFKPPQKSRVDESKTTDQFETDDGFNLTIEIWKTSSSVSYDSFKQNTQGVSGTLKLVKGEDIANGTGYSTYRRDDKEKRSAYESVVQSGDKLLRCELITIDSRPVSPTDVCKTLRAM